MRKKKLLSRKPIVWFHYVILTGLLTGGYYLGDWLSSLLQLNFQSLWIMIPWLFAVLAIGDQAIHYFIDV